MKYSKNKNNSPTIYPLDKNFLIKEITNDEMNKECFDCGTPYPEYISINNGIFICNRCIFYHSKFPDEISTLIKNNLNVLKKRELNFLYYGGNRKLTEFLFSNCPKLNKYQPELLYKTDEMEYYRHKLKSIVNENELEEDKYFLSPNCYSQPLSENRENNKYSNKTYDRKNINNDINDINDIKNDTMTYTKSNNLKKKYNYRKIPINNKNEFDSNRQKIYKTDSTTVRKEYKKRLIPSYNSKTYKGSLNSYEEPKTRTYRQNRFNIDPNFYSNDSYLSKRKTYDINNDNFYNNKYDFDNSGSGNQSWINNLSNEGRNMNINTSYPAQNINYKNYINNTININSPNNNNFYYNFKTENNIITKSPENSYINTNINYIANNNKNLSQYHSFYKKLNFGIQTKLILPTKASQSLILSTSRVYSKPKLPKCRINKRKINKDSDKNKYLTLENLEKNEELEKKILLNDDIPQKKPLKKKYNIPNLKNNKKKKNQIKSATYVEDNFKNFINNYYSDENDKNKEEENQEDLSNIKKIMIF